MNITGFNPAIFTYQADKLIELFEELGFSRTHHDETEEGIINDSVRMKDAHGFSIDVTSSDYVLRDVTFIRMNVDDFEESYQYLLDRGFRNAMGKGVILQAEHWKGAHKIGRAHV